MSNDFIKSFEIAGDGAVGDILSPDRKKNRSKLKVGLLAMTWFEWWPMFPESGMQQTIQADAQRFLERMQEKFADAYELVIPPVRYGLPGRQNADSNDSQSVGSWSAHSDGRQAYHQRIDGCIGKGRLDTDRMVNTCPPGSACCTKVRQKETRTPQW